MTMARIFVISDTHFGHENMYGFTYTCGGTERRVRHEFAGSADADAEMIKRWNATVEPEDHVYHLGDVAFGSSGLAVVKYLTGHKRLVLGNHDKDKITNYLAAGFQKVSAYHYGFKGFMLSHIPLHPMSIKSGWLNVHGHMHQRPPYSDQYRNVSVERINYTPVLLESLR